MIGTYGFVLAVLAISWAAVAAATASVLAVALVVRAVLA